MPNGVTREFALSAVQRQLRYKGHGVVGVSWPPGDGPAQDADIKIMLALPTAPFIHYMPITEADSSNFSDPPFTLDGICNVLAQLRAEDAAAQSQ